MILMISNKVTPVPPPAYYRAQAQLRPALPIDALTDGSIHCICSRCVAWQYAWPIADALPPYLRVQGERLELTAKSRGSSSHSCARCGDCPIRICATGYVTGPRLHWHAACRWARMAPPAFRVRRNSASVESAQEPHCRKRSSCSAS